MPEEEYSLKKIGTLLKEGKAKKTHDMIVYMFQLWLEKLGVPRDSMIVRDFIKVETPKGAEDLEVDIVVRKGDEYPLVVEVVEPDPNWSLGDPEVVKKMEAFVIRSFAHFLKPKYLILTDGEHLYVYDGSAKKLKEIHGLAEIDENKENEIRNLVLEAVR